jgi:hypothetical protein
MKNKEELLKKFIKSALRGYNLPEKFSDVAVDIYPSNYDEIYCHITFLFDKPFSGSDSDLMFNLSKIILQDIKVFFDGINEIQNISTSNSTIDSYNKSKWWYDERKLKNDFF